MSAEEVAINRRLTLENSIRFPRCDAISDVDAAHCYDGIVHSMSSLLCQNEGCPLLSLLVMFGFILSMNYFLRTTSGDYISSYDGKQPIPFQASCQGNRASPTMCLVISMYLVLLMKENDNTSQFISTYSGVCFVLVGFLFVHDTDLVGLG